MDLLERISVRTAATAVLVLNGSAIIFHLLVITRVIPYTIVWGGRLTSESEMVRFESVSIVINLFIAGVAAMAGGFLPNVLPGKAMKLLLWVLFVMLALNTIANPFSATLIEAIVFTPITFLMAVALYRLILSTKAPNIVKAVR